jgi:hypothetical protein
MIVVSEYLRVADRAAELGVHLCDEIAVMPDNFATASSREAFVLRSGNASARLALEGRIVGHEARRASDGMSEDWHVTLFVPYRLSTGKLASGLRAIEGHLGGIAKSFPRRKIALSLIVEHGTDGACKRLTYEGDVSSLDALLDKTLAIAGG